MRHATILTTIKAVTIGLALSLATGAHAQDDEATKVLSKLRQLQPATKFDSVKTSPLPGLFEVAMGRNLAYVDASGRYWVFGHVWDMQSQTDMTQERMADLDRVDFNQLPTELAIRFINGKPLRTLAIFADPNCGYCKVLEKECWRRFKIEPPCRLNFEPGLLANL